MAWGRNEHERRRNRISRVPRNIIRRPNRIALGLYNHVSLGICFRNAALQVLLHAFPLVNWVRERALDESHAHATHKTQNQCWICSFDQLARAVWGHPNVMTRSRAKEEREAGVDARATERDNVQTAQNGWLDTLRNYNPQHHTLTDNRGGHPCVYLGMVFETMMQWAWVPAPMSEDDQLVVMGLFEMEIEQRLQCQKCGKDYSPTEPITDHILHLRTQRPGGTNLYRALDEYFREPARESCCDVDDTMHSSDDRILVAPRILILHLQISSQVGLADNYVKHEVHTVYPNRLDMTRFMSPHVLREDERLIYELSSITANISTGVSDGHALTYAKDYPGRVSLYDDERVSEKFDVDYEDTPMILTYIAVDNPRPAKATAPTDHVGQETKKRKRRRRADPWTPKRKKRKVQTVDQ